MNDELKNGEAIRSLINENLIESCHDISSGGLILCLLEMSIASHIGFKLNTNKKSLDRVKFLFGEDQSRYIVEVDDQNKNSFENMLINPYRLTTLIDSTKNIDIIAISRKKSICWITPATDKKVYIVTDP